MKTERSEEAEAEEEMFGSQKRLAHDVQGKVSLYNKAVQSEAASADVETMQQFIRRFSWDD